MSNDAVPPGSKAEVLKRFGPDVLDYAKSEFVSTCDIPLPDKIKDMLTRAFRSFGWDVWVMRERWTETLPSGKKENEVFPCAPGRDICCADTAAWTLYQTGKLPHETHGDKLWKCDGGGFHWAPYWVPVDGVNTDLVRIVKRSSKLSDFLVKNDGDPRFNQWKTVDDDWLPGDYLLYSKGESTARHPAGQPGHINVYLGPFREIVDGKTIDPVYHLINGSIGEGGGNAVLRPKQLDNLYWYLTTNQTVWHCRVVAVEALFREVVGYPVRLAKPKPVVQVPVEEPAKGKSKDKPKKTDKPKADPEADARAKEALITALWDDATTGATGYPLGRNLSWHDGVHLHRGQHLDGPEVVAFGPGQIAMARMGGPSPYGDTSFVLLQHRLDPKTRRLLAPPAPKRDGDKSDKKKEEIEKRALTLYSLYMHVAPLQTYLTKEVIEGVKALDANAPPWLQRVWVQPVPPPREYVPQTAPISGVLTKGKDHALVALTPAGSVTAPHECDKGACRALTVGGKSFLVLPHTSLPNNAEVWSGHTPVAVVPKGAKLAYVSKRDGTVLELPVAVPEGTTLVASPEGALMIGAFDAATGGVYVAIHAFERPGFKPAKAPFEPIDDNTLRVTGKLSIALDTRGEGDAARLVENQRAKLEASPDKPLVLGYRRSNSGKSKQSDQIWLDLRACVKLEAKDKVAIETKLIADAALAKEVNPRLAARQSSLYAVKIGKDEDWILDDKGMLVGNDASLAKRKPEAQVLTLYPEIKGTGKGRSVVTPKPAKQIDADGPTLLTVQPGAGVAVQPLEIFTNGSKTIGLVEIMFAVDASATVTSHDEEQRVKNRNQKRKKIIDKLLAKEVVDFLALVRDGTLTDVDRSMGAEVVGRFGTEEGGRGGSLHFEIFSGKNLVDPEVKGSEGAAVPVPDSRWLVLKDTKGDLYTPEFVRRLMKELTTLPPPALIDTRPLMSAMVTGVVTPNEWLDFYKANADTLSRLVTVHKPEWAVAWDEVWKDKDTRGRSWTDDLPYFGREAKQDKAKREAAKAALTAARWWTDAVSLPGIDDKSAVFFYHPLRFIEWLKTGVDVTIVGVAKPEDVTLVLVLDGEEISLDYDPVSAAWSFRTVIGDIRQGKNAKLVLKGGIDTENKEIDPVRIRRGEVTTLSLVNPSIKVDVEPDEVSAGFAVAVKQASIGYRNAAYLLADGNRHLARSGYSRATFRVDVAYNVKPPDTLTISIEGDDLRFAEFAVSGTDVTADGDGKPIAEGAKKGSAAPESSGPKPGEDGEPGAASTDGDEPAPEGEGPEPAPAGEKNAEPYARGDGTVVLPGSPPKRSIALTLAKPKGSGPIQRSGSFSVTCEVMVTDAAPGQGTFGKASSVKLVAKASGGDLGQREAKAMRIKTREIKREPDGTPDGEDIAKLQLYLSQIIAADHYPCYRLMGTHKAQVEVEVEVPAKGKRPATTRKEKRSVTVVDEFDFKEELAKKETARVVQIDGGYGGELAKGLWRFVYSYARAKDWELGAVKSTDAKGADKPAVSKDELASVPTEDLLDAHLPTFTSLDQGGDALAAAHADLDRAALDRFLARVNHPDEYPVVDAGLLAEIVKRFRTPFVLPRVSFNVVMLAMPAGNDALKPTNDWTSNWIGNSAMLPSDDEVILEVRCPLLGDVHGDLDVVMSLPDESAYRLDGALEVKAKLADLVAKGGQHKLTPSGKVDADPKHNTVSVRTAADGRLLNKVELCGVPDLGKAQGDALRAAAVLQIYLSVVAADPKKPEAGPLLKHDTKEKVKDKATNTVAEHMVARIDGKWTKAMVDLLGKFEKAYDVSGDYPTVAAALKKAYDDATAPAAPTSGAEAPAPGE